MEPAALRLITPTCHADRRGFVAKTDTRKNYIELGMDFELCRTIIPFLGMAEPSAACIFMRYLTAKHETPVPAGHPTMLSTLFLSSASHRNRRGIFAVNQQKRTMLTMALFVPRL